MSKCEHDWVVDETTSKDKWTRCKRCDRPRRWHQIAMEAMEKVRALEDRLATAVAAHLETKLDVSNAWTEHLSTCWEADTIVATQQRDEAIRERDEARRKALDDALKIVTSDRTHADVQLVIAALLAEEYEPEKEPAILAADKQGYARGIEHAAIAVCRHVAEHTITHDGASACEATLQGKGTPHEYRRSEPRTPTGLYVDFALDRSPIAISETKPEHPSPTLRFFVSEDDYERAVGSLAQADFAILGYKNQERADQYRIATLEMLLREVQERLKDDHP